MEDCADQAIALIRKLQDLPPPLTAQAKFSSPALSNGALRTSPALSALRWRWAPLPSSKPRWRTQPSLFSTFPPTPTQRPLWACTTLLCACSGSPSWREASALVVPVWSLTAALLSTNAHFRCTLRHSSPQRRIATTPLPRHIRLSDPYRSFTLCPPAPTLHPVPLSVLLCGALSSIAILPCTLLSPLLCRLTLRSSQCQLTLSLGRSGQRVPPFRKH
jgi:hypothetical protein